MLYLARGRKEALRLLSYFLHVVTSWKGVAHGHTISVWWILPYLSYVNNGPGLVSGWGTNLCSLSGHFCGTGDFAMWTQLLWRMRESVEAFTQDEWSIITALYVSTVLGTLQYWNGPKEEHCAPQHPRKIPQQKTNQPCLQCVQGPTETSCREILSELWGIVLHATYYATLRERHASTARTCESNIKHKQTVQIAWKGAWAVLPNRPHCPVCLLYAALRG